MAPADDGPQRVCHLYRAFASADRDGVEGTLADDFRFSSPLDVGLDRQGYFERCWPGPGGRHEFEFVELVETADEMIVTYEVKGSDGSPGRDTEILTFQRRSDLRGRGLVHEDREGEVARAENDATENGVTHDNSKSIAVDASPFSA